MAAVVARREDGPGARRIWGNGWPEDRRGARVIEQGLAFYARTARALFHSHDGSGEPTAQVHLTYCILYEKERAMRCWEVVPSLDRGVERNCDRHVALEIGEERCANPGPCGCKCIW